MEFFWDLSLYERVESPLSNETKLVNFRMGKKLKHSIWKMSMRPWSKLRKNCFIEILRHLVVEYRRTQYVFRLNWACIFQPDGFKPRLNCLTSWLIWFFTMNHGNKFFLRFNYTICMIHTIWVTIFIQSWWRNDFDIT